MAGHAVDSAYLGWHGFAGDRRFAFRRLGDESGFPWLTAGRLPELLLYQPVGIDERSGEPMPTHVRTPAGILFELRSVELAREISHRFGNAVELMMLKHGIFDDALVSVINAATVDGIVRGAGVSKGCERFRANIVLETHDSGPFLEDEWVGATLLFGDGESRPAVRVTSRDLRCQMINLDPKTAGQDARVLKTVARLNNSYAGVYGTVIQTGKIQVGQRVFLAKDVES